MGVKDGRCAACAWSELFSGRTPPDIRGMTVCWVFSRDDQQTTLKIVSADQRYTISVHQPNSPEQHTTVANLRDAILREALLEHDLIASGWHLADFRRFPA
jgi:hypothetical protein